MGEREGNMYLVTALAECLPAALPGTVFRLTDPVKFVSTLEMRKLRFRDDE